MYLVRQCWLRQFLLLSGAGEITGAGDGAKISKLMKFHGTVLLCSIKIQFYSDSR
jgi:hypothetical protein